MANFPTPENYPDIYWLGCGTYDEKTHEFEVEYGITPQEGQTTEELVQEVKDAGYPVPPKPIMDICDLTPEEKIELMKSLLAELKNNDCEPCKEKIREQIKHLIECGMNSNSLSNELKEMTNA